MSVENSVRSTIGDRQLLKSVLMPREQMAVLFAALFFSVVGMFLGGNLLIWRLDILKSTAPIGVACLMLLLIFIAVSVSMSNAAWGLVITYGLTVGVTYSQNEWLVTLLYVVAAVSVPYTIWWLRLGLREIGAALLMGVAATTAILGCEATYTSFDLLPRLGAGTVFSDTLFHAAIAAMIKSYGVVSTGLHGLVDTPYHVLSHELIAGISVLSGQGVLEVYGVAPQTLLLPILIFAVAACALSIDAGKSVHGIHVWLAACALLVLGPWLLRPWDFRNTYFVSESYFVSLGLLVLGLPLLFKRRLVLLDILLATILVMLMTRAKASVGLIYFGLWLLRAIFLRQRRSYADFVTMGAVGLTVGLMSFSMASANTPSTISLFALITTHSFHGNDLAEAMASVHGSGEGSLRAILWGITALVSFFALHFIFSWAVVAQTMCRRGWNFAFREPGALYSLGALGAGALIVTLFAIPGGSAYYFSNVSLFVSLPLVCLGIARSYEGEVVASRGRMRLFQAVAIALLVLAAFIALRGAYRLSVTYRHSSPEFSSLVSALLDIRNREDKNVVMMLGEVDALPNPQPTCWAQPFVYPAISERAWIGVMPPRSDCTYKYYNYVYYGLTDSNQQVSVPPKIPAGMSMIRWP